MTDTDVLLLRTLIRKYDVYGVALELCRVLKMYPQPKWKPVQRRAVQFMYMAGVAIGKCKLVQM